MQHEQWAEAPWAQYADSANDPCFNQDTTDRLTRPGYTDPDRWIISNPWLRNAFDRQERTTTAIPFETLPVSSAPSAQSRVLRSIRLLLGLH